MNIATICQQFARIGARAAFRLDANDRVRIDIGRDSDGEHFEIAAPRQAVREMLVLDAQPRLRHLLLMTRDGEEKHKFLCGHDERHWFVAAVPERAAASTVATAFEALKPPAVFVLQTQLGVSTAKRNRRRNAAFVRQGEWFFVPAPRRVRTNGFAILRDEPLRRGGGKPHVCEELVRVGGEPVYVSRAYPNGVTQAEYQRLRRNPKLKNEQWVVQRRNPLVFVRGKVRHADHKTIYLEGWHQVLMNTETQALAMRHVAFID